MSPTHLHGPEFLSTSGATKRLVMFLHGYGANGNDLINLAPMLGLPDTHFMSPHAPFACPMSPGGREWFDLSDRSPANMLRGLQTAAPILNAFIDAQLARFALTPADVALIGFSQGSMMSLYTAPRRAEPIAGVVGISGALFAPELLASEIQSRPPVCLIHGNADDVVPFSAMGLAERTLHANQIPVTAHARPGLAHGIDEQGIAITADFLKRAFKV